MKYIGGAFAQDDSCAFKLKAEKSDFFSTLKQRPIGFETGADALSWILITELKIKHQPVYFPLHYCEETLDRVRLKVANIELRRYHKVEEITDAEAIVVWNHFNGYCPVPQHLLNDRLVVIEDGVQSLQALHHQVGKAAFTSLRKWIELDIAVVIGPYANAYAEDKRKLQHSVPSTYYALKKCAEEQKLLWKSGATSDEESFLRLFAAAEQALQTAEISFHSLEEVEEYNWRSILERRSANAQILLDYLHSKSIPVVGASELFVMITLENRDVIRRYLAQNGIFAPVHWLDSADSGMAKSLLSLPIDQRYTADDMERIVTTLANGFKISGC